MEQEIIRPTGIIAVFMNVMCRYVAVCQYAINGALFQQTGVYYLFKSEKLTHWGRGHLNCLNVRPRGF